MSKRESLEFKANKAIQLANDPVFKELYSDYINDAVKNLEIVNLRDDKELALEYVRELQAGIRFKKKIVEIHMAAQRLKNKEDRKLKDLEKPYNPKAV